MEKRIFEEILDTLKSGTQFTAILDGVFVKGKIEVDAKKRKVWLCFNDGPNGDPSPNKHGYLKSWVIDNSNYNYPKEFGIIQGVEDQSHFTMDIGHYPVGAYVVLLTCGKNKNKHSLDAYTIPTDYVYKLREAYQKDGSSFYIDRDVTGSRGNGYTSIPTELRAATKAECEAYIMYDAPCPAIDLVLPAAAISPIINEYEIY